MIQPDEEILRAILSLEGNASWEVIKKKWFKESAYEMIGPESTGYSKGAQDQVLDIIRKIEKAPFSLKLVEARKPKRSL